MKLRLGLPARDPLSTHRGAHPVLARLVAEAMEPRILHSADVSPLAAAFSADALAGAWTDAPHQRLVSDAAATSQGGQEIAFVDMALPDAQQLVDDLLAQSAAGRPLEVVRIEAGSDGVAVITAALEGRSDISAVHVLSHAQDGVLQLGATTLDATTLLLRSGEVASWGQALSADADLLLYGCDLAATGLGRDLVSSIAALTGADVAASTDLTGAATQGGDWVLEYQAGVVETAVALSPGQQAGWSGVLNTPPVITLPASVAVTQDGSVTFAGANTITLADAEAGTGAVRLDLTATQGVLDLRPIVGSEFQVNLTTASNQQAPRVAVAADGHYVVVWQSNNQDGSKLGVYARIYNADGTARSGEIAVNTTTTDDQSTPAVAIDDSGRFVVAWQSYDTARLTWDIYARSFDANGAALSGQKRITNDAGDQTAPAVAMDGSGNVVIVYQSRGQDNADGNWGIYARTADATLSTIIAESRVNTTTVNAQAAPTVARGATGFVIAWESTGQDGSGTGIIAQRYTASAAKVGGEIVINSTVAGDQRSPSLAMNAAGEFVVAWQSANQDGSGWAVVARRFDAAGTALTGEVLVNTTSAGDQSDPSVVLADDGRFAVAWTSIGQDNADGKAGVYLRSFAANGSALTAETLVNTTTTEAQSAASLGMADTGRMVAVWQSNAQDGNGYGIYGQRMLQPGALRFAAGDGVADASFTVTGTLADLNTALQTLRYTPNAGYWGPASLTATVDDQASGGGPAMSTTGTLTLDVQKINVGPSTTVPGAQATVEDTPIVFSAATGNAITVADPDADPDPVQVTLSAANGTLWLASSTGLTFVGGANGSSSMVVQGRLANLNAALDGLTYRPNADYAGADTLTVVTNDLGNNTVGGPYSATGTVALSISAVNDAPVHVLPSSVSTPENTVLVLSTANGNVLRIADVDAGTGNLEVSLLSTNGTLKLARTTNLAFIVGTGKGGEDQLTFRGKLVDINAALDGMSFTPLVGYAGPAFIEVLSNDLGNSGAGGALADRDLLEITVAPNATNAAPVITVPPNQTTAEETPITLSAAGGNGISVVDDAGGQLLQVTLTVTDGTLTLGTTTGGEFQVNGTVASDQQAPRVAMTPGGGHVVVWQSNNQDGGAEGIYLQRYSDEELPLGPEQRVNTTTAGAQRDPAVAVADDGSFVVVWTSDGQDGDGKGVYGQRFAADGTAVGGEFRVNVTTTRDQMSPSVAADALGNFVVVWQSKDQDGAGWGIYGRRFAANGSALGGEFRINTTTAKDQTAPVVAMADGGAFVVAWQSVRQDGDDWGIYAQRYDAAGVATGSEFRVTTITFKDQLAPAIAADAAGNFVIAWQSKDIDYNDDKFGIYAQRYFADGSANGSQFLVNTRTPGDQTAPAVAMDSAGSFVIAWQSKGQDLKDDPAGIYAQRYDSTGARQGGEFRVNTTTADAQTAPALGVSDTGRMLAVWTSDKQDGSGLGVYGQRYLDARSLGFSVGDGIDDATMTFTGTLEQITDVLDGLVYAPATNFDGKATLTVSVNDLGHSGSGGAKVSTKSFDITVAGVNDAPVISVPPARTLTQGDPVVFSTAGGSAITLADPDAGTKKLLVTLSAPTGTLTLATIGGLQFNAGDGTADSTMTFTGTLAQVNAALDGLTLTLPTGYTGDASVQVYVNDQANTGTGGAWTDQAAARVTVVPDGVNAAPVVSVPQPQRTAIDTSLTLTSTQQIPNAISVVDDSGDDLVRVTVTVTNGTVTLDNRVGAQATANFSMAGDQTEPSLAMLPDGTHIVVWTSSSDGSGSGVYAQRFDASGARIGAEWRVNTTTAGNQNAPDVAADANGGFVVAWVSEGQDGSGRGVYFQRYDADGQAIGTETRANTSISGDQAAPAVAITSSGAFVVVWQADDVNGKGIFAQLFDANGEPAGAEMQINALTQGDQVGPAVAMDAAGNFVVVWQGRDSDAEGIVARRFDVAGNPLGNDFIVNTTVSDKQLAPTLAMNAAGDWVVAWESPDADGSGIFGQRFDAAGATVGSPFAINTTTGGNQIAPSVAINDSGAFVVAWQSADANGQGVFAQAFAADGSAAGRQQLVNTTTAGNQVAPSLGMASDGTYRVVWTGDNQDGLGKGIGMQSMLRADAVTFIAGDGVDDAVVTFTARLADVNALLDGMRFTPNAGFVGVANVAVSVDDLGATGSGGARVGSGDLDIIVGSAPMIDLDANDSAGLPGADYRVNFQSGLGAVRVADTDAALTDPNSGNLQGLTVTITNLLDTGAEVLGFSTGGTAITGSYSAATGVLTFTGTDTVARYQQVLRTITYNNTAASPSTTVRQITFRATDGVGSFSNIATAYVSFGGANTMPTAGDDAYSAVENQALTVQADGVLGNDADAEFDALTATLVSGPAHGTLAFGADGSFTYTPAPGYSGSDSFTYIANDGQADSNVATVQLTVGAVNAAPVGVDRSLVVVEDGTLVLQRADFGFADPADSPANAFLGVRIATLPTAGTLSLYGAVVSAGDFIQVDDIDIGALAFSPAADANGTGYASFTFQVRDDGGTDNGGVDLDPTPRTLTIDVIPDADVPFVAAPIADQAATEGLPFSFQFAANTFADVDAGDTLSYAATLEGGGPWPAWLTFDAANRTFGGTPTSADVGTIAVRVTATDAGGATAHDAFLLTVAVPSGRPLITSNGGGDSAAVNVVENTTAVTTVTATDPDGPALTYSISGGADAARFDIVPSTGLLSFLSAPDYEAPNDADGDRTYHVVVRASDGTLWDEQALAVSVTDVSSALTVTTTADVLDGNTASIELLVANPGADGLISLREAIIAANNTAGADAISLPAGTYTIGILGAGDDQSVSGDFDIRDSLTILGAGAAGTAISGGNVDAVMEIVAGNVSLSGLTVRDGYTPFSGAGIQVNSGASLTLDQVVVRNNASSGFNSDGGGISNQGALTVIDSEIRNNAVFGGGGGIYHTGSALTLQRVTVAENGAWQGAGIYDDGDDMALTNVTLSSNVAGYRGGALFITEDAALLNVTLANNAAFQGGGLYANDSEPLVTLRNVLLAGNVGGNIRQVAGVTSLGNNLSDTATPELNQASDQVAASANLGALADNGGFGRTHALLDGSAAIDAGNTAAAPPTDQRGTARVGGADIGAYETAVGVNRMPLNTVPGAQSVLEDTSTAIAGLSVNDPDQGNGIALHELSTTTLSVSNGALQVTLAAGATISAGANGSATLTLAGSQADINATLATLRYRGNANYVGGDTLVMVSRDGAGLTDSDDLAITVTGVNDAPGGTDATLTVPANGSYTLQRADFGFADVPGEGDAFVSVIVAPATAGLLRLAGTAISAATEVTVAQLDAGSLVFVPDAGASGAAYATLAFQVRDGGGTANGGVNVDPVANTLTFDVSGSGIAAGQLWFSTRGPVVAAGGTGWTAGQIARFGDTGDTFDIGGGATGGTVALLPGFTAPQTIRGLHYVQTTLTLGTTGPQFVLNPGDLVMVLDPGAAPATVTLNAGDGNPANDIVADRRDIVVFRPSVAGNYASGAWHMLLDDAIHDGATVYNPHAISIVEADTAVGGTLLSAGTIVLAHSDPSIHNNVYVTTVIGTGVGTSQTADTQLLIDGSSLGLGADQIQGLHLLTQATSFEGTTLSAGTLLAAVNGTNTFAGVPQDTFDVVALTVTRTELELSGGTLATGQMLFDGSDIGLDAATDPLAVNLGSLTVVSSAAANTPPVVTSPASASVPEGTTLVHTLTATDAEAHGVVFAITGGADMARFTIDGGSRLLFTTAPDYEARGDQDGDNVYRVQVRATDSLGASVLQMVSVSVTNLNEAPSGAPLITGTPTEDQMLSADSSAIGDADGLGTFSYQWTRNGANISGATASTYTLGDADVGAQIRVVVGYTDGGGTAESVTSAVAGPVANVNDVPTGAPIVTGTPTEDQMLSADSSAIGDADGLGTFSYQWTRNGANISGATASTYTLGDVDVGAQIRVVVGYTDGGGTAESLTSAAVGPVANVNDAPGGSVTIDDTTPAQGQTLTASHTLTDADGLGLVSYQWQRNGVDIAGATGTTYTATQADVGEMLRVIASYTDGQGRLESVGSADTGAVANVNDAPSGAPVITGTPTEDQTLSADTSAIGDADGLGAFSYQWTRNGASIAGATGSTYILGDADVGAQIRVVVGYTDGGGASESLTSAALGPVAGVNDVPTGAPIVTGTPTEDQMLSADTSTIGDADGLGAFSYQWTRNGAAIAGATGSTYTLGDADVGAQIRVVVGYTDGGGTAESLSSAALGPVANVNDAPTGAPVITGTPTENQTLGADTRAIADADADGLGVFSYQWTRNGAAIAGATASTYTLGDADVGAQIRVVVGYTDAQGTAESLTSAALGPVTNVNDVPTGAPAITGTPTENQTLGADTSAIGDADGLGVFSYQWTRNGAAIAGATASTYTLGDADVGTLIRVVVGYTDGGGTSESLTSAALGPVAGVDVEPSAAALTTDMPTSQTPTSTATSSASSAPPPAAASQPVADRRGDAVGTTTAGNLLQDASATPVDDAMRTGVTRAQPSVDVGATVVSASDGRADHQRQPSIFELAAFDDAVIQLAAGNPLWLGRLNLADTAEAASWVRAFESMRDQVTHSTEVHSTQVAYGATLSVGVSVGYVMWMLRGGLLLSSVLAALPAWQLIDPLPLLARSRLREEDRSASDDDVEQVFDDGNEKPSRRKRSGDKETSPQSDGSHEA
jgi:hypothetical protein